MTDATAARSLTITWEDPAASLAAGDGLSGLEYLQRMADGRIPPPPIGQLMGFAPTSVQAGRVEFSCTPGEQHYNPIGMVHGGLACTLLDSVMGCAVQSTLPAGVAYTSLDITVHFTRAMRIETGEVRAIGTVVHGGGRVATAEGRIEDADGRLYGHATTTCLILRPAA